MFEPMISLINLFATQGVGGTSGNKGTGNSNSTGFSNITSSVVYASQLGSLTEAIDSQIGHLEDYNKDFKHYFYEALSSEIKRDMDDKNEYVQLAERERRKIRTGFDIVRGNIAQRSSIASLAQCSYPNNSFSVYAEVTLRQKEILNDSNKLLHDST
jgi:hypothetical protein